MGQHNDIDAFIEGAKAKRILVVGDYILDKYRFMTPKSLSPEAPIVCFTPSYSENRDGGAGNVVRNLEALGAETYFLTATGDDLPLCLPGKFPFHVTPSGRLTVVKERILTHRQQVARIDTPLQPTIDAKSSRVLVEAFFKMPKMDAIIFSDYDHGCLSAELVEPIMTEAKRVGIPTIVDSKAMDTISKYQECSIAIPNTAEASKILKIGFSPRKGTERSFEAMLAKSLRSALQAGAVALTLGPDGIFLDCASESIRYDAVNGENEVVDVTGAGDTVAAVVALGLALGLAYGSIMRMANIAAGVKVQKLGVATITASEMKKMESQTEK